MKVEIHEPPHPDLPAWSYTESSEYNGRQWRQVRRTKVFQLNRIVDYVEDLGPSNPDVSFVIPGGVKTSHGYESLHTVGQLHDIAAEFKLSHGWHKEVAQPHDLYGLYHDEMERRHSVARGRKVYGRVRSRRE